MDTLLTVSNEVLSLLAAATAFVGQNFLPIFSALAALVLVRAFRGKRPGTWHALVLPVVGSLLAIEAAGRLGWASASTMPGRIVTILAGAIALLALLALARWSGRAIRAASAEPFLIHGEVRAFLLWVAILVIVVTLRQIGEVVLPGDMQGWSSGLTVFGVIVVLPALTGLIRHLLPDPEPRTETP